jgi:hypothetical protein
MLVRTSKDGRTVRRPKGRRVREYRFRHDAFGRRVGTAGEIPRLEEERCLQCASGSQRTLRRCARPDHHFGDDPARQTDREPSGPRSGRFRFGGAGKTTGSRFGDDSTGQTDREPSGPDPTRSAPAERANGQVIASVVTRQAR